VQTTFRVVYGYVEVSDVCMAHGVQEDIIRFKVSDVKGMGIMIID